MGSRGHWLEAAVEASNEEYRKGGVACIQKVPTPAGMTRKGTFYRTRSTVDFLGVFNGSPVAFDAKVTRLASLPLKNVHDHQIAFLSDFRKAGGIGALLICFEKHGHGSFLVDVNWYEDVVDQTCRKSIPLSRFEIGAGRKGEACEIVPHGTNAVPVDYRLALEKLWGML